MRLDASCRVAVQTPDGAVAFGVAEQIGDGEVVLRADGDFEVGESATMRLELSAIEGSVTGVFDILAARPGRGGEPARVRGRLVSMSVADRLRLVAWEEARARSAGVDSNSSLLDLTGGRESVREALRAVATHRSPGRRVTVSPDGRRVELRWSLAAAVGRDLNDGLLLGRLWVGPLAAASRVTLRMVLPDAQALAVPARYEEGEVGGVLRFRPPLPLKTKLRAAARGGARTRD